MDSPTSPRCTPALLGARVKRYPIVHDQKMDESIHMYHLATSIPTGTFCTYTPDPTTPLTWLLSLITCTAALSIVTTPLYMALILGLAQHDLHVPTALLMKQLLIAVMAPMLAGML